MNGRRMGDALRALLASERAVEVEIGFGRGDFLLDRSPSATLTTLSDRL